MVYQVIPGYLEWRGLPRAWISTTMTLGQMTEIAMLAVLSLAVRRFGVKGTMTLGIAAWFLRFLSLAFSRLVAGRRRHTAARRGIRVFHRRWAGLHRRPVVRSLAGKRPGTAAGVHVGARGVAGQRDGG